MSNARGFPDYELIPNFKASEFACKCNVCRCGMPTLRLLSSLDALRRAYGEPIRIVSALRCIYHNRIVGGTKNSAHLRGEAVDVAGDAVHTLAFLEAAIRAGFGGIGQGKGRLPDGSQFAILHLDVRKVGGDGRPESWTYTAPGKRVNGNVMVDAAWRRFRESCEG